MFNCTLIGSKFATKTAKVSQAPSNGRHQVLNVLDDTKTSESRERKIMK